MMWTFSSKKGRASYQSQGVYLCLAEGCIAGRVLGAHRDRAAKQASAAAAAGKRGFPCMQRCQEWHLPRLYIALLPAEEWLAG